MHAKFSLGILKLREHLDDLVLVDLKEIGWAGMDWINLAQDRD
jgi:hypothetical protein